MRILLPLLAAIFWTACSAPDHAEQSSPDVIGGEPAQRDYDYFAGIADTESEFVFCGGTFISSSVVVTAAHCVDDNRRNLQVWRGLKDLNEMGQGQAFPVVAVAVHPNYDPMASNHDIALLFLDPDLTVGLQDPTAVRLPTRKLAVGTAMKVVGFGNTTSFGYYRNTRLMEVEVPLVGDANCSEAYPVLDKAQSICAGIMQTGGRDSCQGDSGGPLFIEQDGFVELFGVVSYGYGCAQPGNPGVYSDVRYFTEWIKATIAEMEDEDESAVLQLTDRYCYSGMNQHTVSSLPGLGYLEHTTSYEINSFHNAKPGKELSAKLQPRNLCDSTTLGGAPISVDLSETEPPELTITVDGQQFQTEFTATRKTTMTCESNSYEYFYYGSFDYFEVTNGSQVFLGYSETPPTFDEIDITNSCTIDDVTVGSAFWPEGQQNVGFIIFAGDPSRSKIFRLSKTGDHFQVKMPTNYTQVSDQSAIVEFINNPDYPNSIFTWQLSCSDDFILTDRDRVDWSATLNSVDGSFTVQFEYPTTVVNSMIPSGESKTFLIKTGAAASALEMNPDLIRACTFNSIPLELSVTAT